MVVGSPRSTCQKQFLYYIAHLSPYLALLSHAAGLHNTDDISIVTVIFLRNCLVLLTCTTNEALAGLFGAS